MSNAYDTQIPDQYEQKIQTRKKIVEFLLGKRQGALPHEIAEFAAVKRQTIHNHLKELIQDDVVYERNHRYFIKDLDIVFRHWCGNILKDGSKIILNPALVSSEFDLSVNVTRDSENISLSNHVSGITPSEKFCKAKFSESSAHEKLFFDFANRLGAYILYVFIESLRPGDSDNIKRSDTMTQEQRKRSLSAQLIKKSIDMEVFYDIFRTLLKDLEFNKLLDKNKKRGISSFPHNKQVRDFSNSKFLEMNKSDFENVRKSFMNIYPKIHEGLEKYWDDQTVFVGYDLDTLESMFHCRSECDHKWKDIKIYKKDLKYYECLKCRQIANEYVKTRLEQRKRH